MSTKSILSSIRDFLTQPVVLFLVFVAGFIGLYYSRALVSLFNVTIFGLGLMALTKRSDIRQAIWNRHTIPFLLVFCVYLISFFLSDDKMMALLRLKTNNYFILIPVGISLLQPFSKRFITHLIFAFISITCLSCLLVAINYGMHFEEYSEIYKTGKTIPTPILHIRYSYFMSLALLLGLVLYLDRSRLMAWMKKLLPFMLIFLFIFLHVLAVRSGLLAFYAGLFVFALISGRHYLRPRYMIGIGMSLILILLLAIRFIPSLKNKWQYTQHDIDMFFNDTGSYLYSDNLRLISIKHGLDLVESNPMIGVGIGDIEKEMQTLYKYYNPEIPPELQALPINQIIFALTAFGLVGGILYFIFLFYPLAYPNQWNDPKLLMIYGATFGSFMGDASIELQLGKVAFLTLITLALWDTSYKSENQIINQGS